MLYLTPFTTIYCCVLAALLGATAASFLMCSSGRILRGESALKGRSHCDSCGHVLGARELIPVVSYFIQRGKCRHCGAKLSPIMPIGELAGSALFVVTLLKFDISLRFLEAALFTAILMGVTFADLEGYIIPDRYIIAAILVRLGVIGFGGNILHEGLLALLGGVSVALPVLGVVLIMEKILKREAMGGGDIKLLFVTGLYLGWQRNILCVILACILGIIFGLASQRARADNEDAKAFPWGPSIAAAAWLCLLWGGEVLSWYLRLFTF